MILSKLFNRDNTPEKVAESKSLFQVRESEGELWLTYSGCLVCPCAMLKELPVEALEKMRELYVKRESNKR